MASKPKTQDQIEVRKPTRMPRPLEKEMGKLDATDDKRTLSPLGVYMKQTNVSTTQLARALGVAHKTVQELRDGVTQPTLVMAYEVERVTKGVVPMEAWMGTAKAKAALAKQRAQQPEEVQQIQPRNTPGAFAAPAEKKQNPPPRKRKDET